MIVKYVQDMLIAASLAGGRVYPDELPPAPTYPAIVCSLVTARPDYDMQGDTRTPDSRVQIDCYHDKGYSAVVALTSQAYDVVTGFKSTAESAPCVIQGMFVINEMDLDVSETEKSGPKLRRRMLEIRVWSNTNA